MRSDLEHDVTSTGAKFFRHPSQMMAYRAGQPRTVISTHISPEGACNLQCSYCSVRRRGGGRLDLAVVQDYIYRLMSAGLRAVIITGGGEPLLYPQFEQLVLWLKECGLSVALITNGTLGQDLSPQVCECFSWIRISLNPEAVIRFPVDRLPLACRVGFSKICTLDTPEREVDGAVGLVTPGVTYLRLLPDCTLPEPEYHSLQARLRRWTAGRPGVFVQHKERRPPVASACHQAYFRPYLSEEGGGTVYPCDSVVLNDGQHKFQERYRICKAHEVSSFLSGKIAMKFRPCDDCHGCVFANTVDMLDAWQHSGAELEHEEFV